MIQRKILDFLMSFTSDKQKHGGGTNGLVEAQTRHIYRQGIAGIRGSVVAAGIMVIALRDDASTISLTIWLLCYATACFIGEVLKNGFDNATAQAETTLIWRRRFVFLAIVGGILWGLTPIVFFPTQSLFSQAMLTFVLGGISVGITTSHGSMREVYVPFILLVYLPLIGRYIYEGGHVHLNMAALLFVFMVYLLGSAGRMHRTVMDALKLRLQNKALLDDLTRRKTAAFKLNQALQSETSERSRAEALLRQSEQKYRRLFEISPDAMAVHSEGKILLANQATARLLNAHSPDALVGRQVWEFVEEDCLAISRMRVRQVEHEERSAECIELKLLSLDKTPLHVEVASVPSMYKDKPAVLTVIHDVTRTKLIQERLKASLEEKEVLLREIHHRVKNNLQIISSLLKLQLKFAGRKPVEDIFSDSEIRLQCLVLLHERLYESNDLTNIDFRSYVGALVPNLLQSYGGHYKHIRFENCVEKTRFSLDTAIPCGLIVNELVSNCLKHAFPNGRQGKVEVSLTPFDKQYRLQISDDGIGLPEDIDPPNPDTLGLRLVNTLVRQLQGRVSVDRSCGTEYHIVFNELNPTQDRIGLSATVY